MNHSTQQISKKAILALLPMLLAFFLSISPAQGKEQEPAANHLAPQTAQTGGVSIIVNPPTSNVPAGDTFIVTIQVEAGSTEVNGVSAYLNFDPSFVQVQSMTPMTSLIELQNSFDNNSGQIDYAVGSFSGPYPTGTFDLLQVELQAIAETASTTLAFQSVNPRQTDVTSPSTGSVLTASSDGIVTVQGNSPPSECGDNDDITEACVTVIQTSGTITYTMNDVLFPDIFLNGTLQVAEADTHAFVFDADNLGTSWSFMLSADAFSDGAGNTIPVGGTDQFTVECQSVSPIGSADATPTCEGLGDIPLESSGNQVNVFSADPGTGNGNYDALARFQLTIPASTVEGSYLATLYPTVMYTP